MLKLTANEIREKWIDFFKNKNHKHLPPLSIVPKNDNSLLFVNSGISAIKEYFLEKTEKGFSSIVNCQPVIRTKDIENIGKTHRHHTCFEMLGNFSISSYFKKEAIYYAYEFLIQVLQIDYKNLIITVYEEDDESYKLWNNLFKNEVKIFKFGKDKNFWNMGVGPCGPCSEIYYDRGEKYDPKNLGIKLLVDDIENDRYLEIWNIVFSEFITKNNEIIKTENKKIDTGLGLERVLTIIENSYNNFENSLFLPIINTISLFTETKYIFSWEEKNLSKNNNFYFQVISDHLKAVVMILSEEIDFGNKGRNYVVRKLFRKVMVYSKILKINNNFLIPTIEKIISIMSSFYKHLIENKNFIFEKIFNEEIVFEKILKTSSQLIEKINFSKNIEAQVFQLVERHGVPIDIIDEILIFKNISYDKNKYLECVEKHKQKSKNINFQKAFSNLDNTINNFEATICDYEKKHLNAKIIKIYDENFLPTTKLNVIVYLLLDKTIFFPNIAGQDCDKGFLKEKKILEVIKINNKYSLHKIENNIFEINQLIDLTLCLKNRKLISSHHTAEHLFFYLMQKKLSKNIQKISAKKENKKFILHFYSEINLNIKIMKDFLNILNKTVKKGASVKKYFINREEAKALGGEKIINKNKSIDFFQVVEIQGINKELCIGTHVNDINEIEKMEITFFKNNNNNNYEVHVFCNEKNIHEFLTIRKEEFFEKFKKKFQDLQIYYKKSKIKVEKIEKNIKKINLFFLKTKNLFFDKSFLEINNEFDLIFNEIFELTKDIENIQNIENINNLKKILDSEENVFELQNYSQKVLYNFLKKQKIIGLKVFFNNCDNKIQFFIVGNNEFNGLSVLKFLQEKYGAFGRKNEKIIVGNIENFKFNANKENIQKFIFSLNKKT